MKTYDQIVAAYPDPQPAPAAEVEPEPDAATLAARARFGAYYARRLAAWVWQRKDRSIRVLDAAVTAGYLEWTGATHLTVAGERCLAAHGFTRPGCEPA